MRYLPAAAAIIVVAFVLILLGGFFYIIDPGERGVKVSLGKMSDEVLQPGPGLKMPLVSQIRRVSVQQDTREMKAECYSADLQQIDIQIKVLYRIPEQSTVKILRDYSGEPFEQLIVPRVQEAVKEVTALRTAADIVKTREQIKNAALTSARQKVGELLALDDLVIEDVSLSKELERAIEAKMVQQQEAEQAVFRMQQSKTDAERMIIEAKGQAESIRIQGEALEKNPKLVELKMVEKWNGVAPQVVGAGTSIMLPINNK
jgi:prohibitin 2